MGRRSKELVEPEDGVVFAPAPIIHLTAVLATGGALSH
jgi:hypothetical protein